MSYLWSGWSFGVARFITEPRPLQAHGLGTSMHHRRELGLGLVIGLISLGLLFTLEGWLGWLTWQPTPANIGRIGLEGLLVGLGVSFAEELLFRGWLLDELRYRLGDRLPIYISRFCFCLPS
ncbi:MAG: CPBP family intramembrane metalloprotease [Leptolyngbyaceae cyanobacterium SM2_3_12]|nr:CPBP family intramembrane metalloprotease [Leptolyngbyaceae cyanobacterium SM2_3_12]